MTDRKIIDVQATKDPAPESTTKTFDVERIYVKKSSMELIDAPNSLLLQWQPEVHLEIKNSHSKWSEKKLFEAVLSATIKIKIADKEICTCSADQAGIFKLEGFSEEEAKRLLSTYCADVLYPYLRQTIAELLTSSSLPAILLKPLSFEAIYQQQEKEKGKQDAANATIQ